MNSINPSVHYYDANRTFRREPEPKELGTCLCPGHFLPAKLGSGSTKRATSVNMTLRLQSSEGKFTKSREIERPYTGPSAGTEVVRLQKWHVWCLLGIHNNIAVHYDIKI